VPLSGYEDRPGRGRHRQLSLQIEHAWVKWITTKIYDDKAVNRTELSNYCVTNLGTAITTGLIDSFPVMELSTEHIEFARSILIVPSNLRGSKSRDRKILQIQIFNLAGSFNNARFFKVHEAIRWSDTTFSETTV
jgi:hypothetical protein